MSVKRQNRRDDRPPRCRGHASGDAGAGGLLRHRLTGKRNECTTMEMRDDMLRLHQLAMRVVKEGSTAPAIVDEMFELATYLQSRIDDLSDALDRMRETIGGLAMLAPDE